MRAWTVSGNWVSVARDSTISPSLSFSSLTIFPLSSSCLPLAPRIIPPPPMARLPAQRNPPVEANLLYMGIATAVMCWCSGNPQFTMGMNRLSVLSVPWSAMSSIVLVKRYSWLSSFRGAMTMMYLQLQRIPKTCSSDELYPRLWRSRHPGAS